MYFCVCADEKLLSILRHHNFLKELQEIAAQGESPISHSECVCAECACLWMQMKSENKLMTFKLHLSFFS